MQLSNSRNGNGVDCNDRKKRKRSSRSRKRCSSEPDDDYVEILDDEAAGDQIVLSRHTDSTRDGYASCFRGITKYLQSKVEYRMYIEDNPVQGERDKMRIVLPLPLHVVKAIFGFLATKRIRESTTRRKPQRSNNNGKGAISHDDIDSRALRVRYFDGW